MMDDLTRINGVGPATAQRLAQAGAGSFAALAAVDPQALAAHEALRGVRASPADLSAWIAAAAELAAAARGTDPAQAHDPGSGDGSATEGANPGAAPPVPTTQPRAAHPRPVLVVTGPRQGRWRAGRRFDAQPVRIPIADLSDDERSAIEADPMLNVESEEEQEPGT